MKRKNKEYAFSANELSDIKQKMLNWLEPFSIFLLLDSNEYHNYPHSKYEFLVGVCTNFNPIIFKNMEAIQDWNTTKQDWLLGHIAYDYKNELEPCLCSQNQPLDIWENIQFFCPEIVCYIKSNTNSIVVETIDINPEIILNQILNTPIELSEKNLPKVEFKQHVSISEYKEKIHQIKQHIIEGDCYELNYCCAASSNKIMLKPQLVFHRLNSISPAPFASFYRNNNQYLMCASPERYLQKNSSEILSMPIKGTSKRGKTKIEDDLLKKQLNESQKNKAENVMIVDLVRNDLARTCTVGSIEVTELFGIYSFPQVHQMISTVKGQLKPTNYATDCIKKSFPMGSMTGAPKIKVMQLIDSLENQSRGLFSGSVGYFNPDGDFDFNVVIRSLFYNQESQILHYETGGAITIDSEADEEYEEMRLKAWALERIFNQ